MRSILVIILSLFGCSFSDNAFTKKSDLLEANLIGNVLSVRQNRYEAVEKFGEITRGEKKEPVRYFYMDEYTVYNNRGNKTEFHYYDWDGSFNSKFIYKYDNKDNKIESHAYDSKGNLFDKSTFKYNDNGKMIEEDNNRDSVSSKTLYKYDDKGNQVELNMYEFDGKLKSKWIYKYDDKGNEIEHNMYKSNGKLESKRTYKYDNKGNQIEMDMSMPTMNLESVWTWKYDDKRNIIQWNTHDNKGIDEKFTYEYTYDNIGNWIKKIEFKDNIPTFIYEREIQYQQ